MMEDKQQKIASKDFVLVVISFLTIFIFVTIDNVISPLIEIFHQYYSVSMPEVLRLVSSCTFGIVLGTFCGPIIIRHFKIFKTYLLTVVSFAIFLLLFLYLQNFNLALVARFFLGISSGLFASCFWWITFHGVSSKPSKDAMISVMIAARPVAISLGVPLLVATALPPSSWQLGFLGYGIVLVLINFYFLKMIIKKNIFPHSSPPPSSVSFSSGNRDLKNNLFEDYFLAIRSKNFSAFYGAAFLTSIAYFGFYSISGYWFLSAFDLGTSFLSALFLYVGAGEVLATFLAPFLNRKFSTSATSTTVLCLTTIVVGLLSYVLFASNYFSLWITVVGISIFLISNRVYVFLMMSKVPSLFPDHPNKSTLASLITLISWLAFAFVSYLQSYMAQIFTLRIIGFFMFGCLLIGFMLSIPMMLLRYKEV